MPPSSAINLAPVVHCIMPCFNRWFVAGCLASNHLRRRGAIAVTINFFILRQSAESLQFLKGDQNRLRSRAQYRHCRTRVQTLRVLPEMGISRGISHSISAWGQIDPDFERRKQTPCPIQGLETILTPPEPAFGWMAARAQVSEDLARCRNEPNRPNRVT